MMAVTRPGRMSPLTSCSSAFGSVSPAGTTDTFNPENVQRSGVAVAPARLPMAADRLAMTSSTAGMTEPPMGSFGVSGDATSFMSCSRAAASAVRSAWRAALRLEYST